MKVLNTIALILGWIDIIGLVVGAVFFIIRSALSLIYLLAPLAVIIVIIVLIVKKK